MRMAWELLVVAFLVTFIVIWIGELVIEEAWESDRISVTRGVVYAWAISLACTEFLTYIGLVGVVIVIILAFICLVVLGGFLAMFSGKYR